MNRSIISRGWSAYFLSALIMLLIMITLLLISRNQLHKQVIESEFFTLKTAFEKILRDEMLDSLSEDLNLSDSTSIPQSTFFNTSQKIEQAALQSLKIPQVFGVQGFDSAGRSINLATAIDTSSLEAEMISDIHSHGWHYRVMDDHLGGLSIQPEELEDGYFVEFQILSEPLKLSWQRIDQTLIRNGSLLGIAALALLAIVYRNLINKLIVQETLLVEKTRILTETNRKLSQAYKSAGLGAMTGHLLHGLKTPLTTLKSLSDELNQSANQSLEPAFVQTMEKIQNRVNRVLESLQELEVEEINYTISTEEFCKILQARFERDFPEATLKIEQGKGAGVNLDNLQCHLSLAILLNLFQNSTDEKKDALVDLKLQVNDKSLKILVSDNAGGIDRSKMNRLFSPLVSSKTGGSGIGLALSNQLAESMDATLELCRNDNEGVCFSLNLPLHQFSSEE